jgi:hypothetical protein
MKISTTSERRRASAQKAKVVAAAQKAEADALSKQAEDIESGKVKAEKERLRAEALSKARSKSSTRAFEAGAELKTPALALTPKSVQFDFTKTLIPPPQVIKESFKPELPRLDIPMGTTRASMIPDVSRITSLPKSDYQTPKEKLSVQQRESQMGANKAFLGIVRSEEKLGAYPVEDDVFKGTDQEYSVYKQDYSNYQKNIEDYNKSVEESKQLQEQIRKAGFLGAVGKIEYIEKPISKKIPTWGSVIEKSVSTVEAAGLADEFVKFHEVTHKTPTIGSATEGLSGFGQSKYEHFQKEPITAPIEEIGIPAAEGYGAGLGYKLVSYGLRKGIKTAAAGLGTSTLAGKGLTTIGTAIEPAAGVGMVGAVGVDIAASKDVQEGLEKTFKYGVGFAGASYGWKAGTSLIGNVRVRGRTEIPLENIVEPEVLSGIEAFPMTKKGETPTEVISRFKTSQYKLPSENGLYAWHATPKSFKSSFEVADITARKTDVPGMYVSPTLSPYFLRLQALKKSQTTSRIFGSSSPLEPTILRIGLEDISRIPKSKRYDYLESSEFLKTGAKKGSAYLTPSLEMKLRSGGKVEAEAVITPYSTVKKIDYGEKYYVKVHGSKVPIETYRTMSGIRTISKIEPPKSVRGLLNKTEYYKEGVEGIVKPYSSIGSPKYKGSLSNLSVIGSVGRISKSKIKSEKPSSRQIIRSSEKQFSYKPTLYGSSIKPYPRSKYSEIGSISENMKKSEYIKRPSGSEKSYKAKSYDPYKSKVTPISSIKPFKQEKLKDKKKRKEKKFEWFINNPIASVFPTVGKMKNVKTNTRKKSKKVK